MSEAPAPPVPAIGIPSGTTRGDRAWALAVFCAAGIAFWVTRQAWLFGDGNQP